MHPAFQLKVFFFLLIVENTHGIKFIITILHVQLSSAKYMYIVVQPISRTFLFSKTETLTTISPSSFCSCEFDYSRTSHKWNYTIFVFFLLTYFT